MFQKPLLATTNEEQEEESGSGRYPLPSHQVTAVHELTKNGSMNQAMPKETQENAKEEIKQLVKDSWKHNLIFLIISAEE